MTGMDQDMMQKNLSCKNEKDAKKYDCFQFYPFYSNVSFYVFRALLYAYAEKENISIP